MRNSLVLLALIFGAFAAITFWFGFEIANAVGIALVAAMSVTISATFFWLWRVRATPLALGMSFSWAGAACVLGWLWVVHVLPAATDAVLSGFIAIYFIGAALHLAVIQRSFGFSILVVALPLVAAMLLLAAALSRI